MIDFLCHMSPLALPRRFFFFFFRQFSHAMSSDHDLFLFIPCFPRAGHRFSLLFLIRGYTGFFPMSLIMNRWSSHGAFIPWLLFSAWRSLVSAAFLLCFLCSISSITRCHKCTIISMRLDAFVPAAFAAFTRAAFPAYLFLWAL